MRPTIMIGALACAAMLGMMSAAPAQTALKVIVFPGLSNFSIYAAQHKNLFAKHGLAIELIYTPNSTVLREGLAKGDYQIAQAGVDNSVAMVELAKADAIIVAGGDNGFNHIFVQPEVTPISEARRSWSTRPIPPLPCCSTRCSRITASTKVTTWSSPSARRSRDS